MDPDRSELPRLLAWVAFVLLGTLLAVSIHVDGLSRVLAEHAHRPECSPHLGRDPGAGPQAPSAQASAALGASTKARTPG